MITDHRLKEIMTIIEDLGHQVLIVGGAVRNHLLNREIIDYDLATSAKIKDLSQVFLNSTIIYRDQTEWALKINHKGFVCEVSTFRIEKDYKNRIPQTMIYVNSYQKDYLRRDFTINALAYSLNGQVLDYCNGLSDLENRLVKSIKDSKESFLEDEMRILRGLRLASTLNFTIEKNTLKQMQSLYKTALDPNLDIVHDELRRIIAGSNFDYVYNNFTDLFMDISNYKFKNMTLKNRDVLILDDILYIYFKYKLNLSVNNPIYAYFNLSINAVDKVKKLDPLFLDFMAPLDFMALEVLFITYGKDKLAYVVDCLSKFDLVKNDVISTYHKILETGYFRISDLKVSEKDLGYIPTLKERYKILKKLQVLVVKNKLLNNRKHLLEKALDLFNKEKA